MKTRFHSWKTFKGCLREMYLLNTDVSLDMSLYVSSPLNNRETTTVTISILYLVKEFSPYCNIKLNIFSKVTSQ